jgi:hypothetical protein
MRLLEAIRMLWAAIPVVRGRWLSMGKYVNASATNALPCIFPALAAGERWKEFK